MRTCTLLIIPLLAAGCVTQDPTDNLANWKCTPEQLNQVINEFNVCDKSSYYSSHCFLTAKQSLCTYVEIVK